MKLHYPNLEAEDAETLPREEAELAALPPGLRRTLGLLDGAPDGVAELTLLTLPYEGSLRTLEELHYVELEGRRAGRGILGGGEPTSEPEPDLLSLKITDRGRHAITLLAELPESEQRRELIDRYSNLVDPDQVKLKVEPA